MPSQKPSDRRRGGLDDELPEPDMTPMMNLTFMLILALLTMASIMPMGLISVQAPQITGGGGGGPKPKETKKPLTLTIFVTKDGFNLAASGATLDGSSDGREGQTLFPRIDEGGKKNYDFAKLNQRLSIIKKSFPLEQSVIITADEDVIYEDIVRTMDAAREDADGNELFPAVAFSAGIVG
ncbi:MAG: biopolymer transporter ExbD [Deltaproteobacteria bacterium]|nr:biopolymer transporter ExbD [Deltaproteobacteria bacterium]